jgi:flagellar hook-associated protein 3 FlgL
MRITNNMRHEQVLRNISQNLRTLAKTQEEVATGKRFTRASEDPVAAAQVMRADRSLRGIEQYRRNQSATRTALDAEESVLDQLGDVLTRARELGLAQASDTANAASRANAAAEVERLLEQARQLGNTRVGNDYIFAGHQSGGPPFLADGSYVGDDGRRQAEIAEDYRIDTTHNGRQVFLDTGTIAGLQRLHTALAGGDRAEIEAATGDVTTAFDDIQVVLAETGARVRQMDLAGANLDAYESSLLVRKELDQGITIEEATTRMLSVQNTLQAALLSTSRLLNTSLTEYLR